MRRDVSFVKLGPFYNIIAKGYVIIFFFPPPESTTKRKTVYIRVGCNSLAVWGLLIGLWRIDVLTGVINTVHAEKAVGSVFLNLVFASCA
jgi:uncharacterized membrane protein